MNGLSFLFSLTVIAVVSQQSVACRTAMQIEQARSAGFQVTAEFEVCGGYVVLTSPRPSCRLFWIRTLWHWWPYLPILPENPDRRARPLIYPDTLDLVRSLGHNPGKPYRHESSKVEREPQSIAPSMATSPIRTTVN